MLRRASPTRPHIVATLGQHPGDLRPQAAPTPSTNLKQRLDLAGTGLYMPYAVKPSGVWHNLEEL
jgi:hypothetical protein